MSQPMYYFHITNDAQWKKKGVLLSPRIPKTADDDEPKIRRICVCSSVLNCFVATTADPGWRVYRTREKLTNKVVKVPFGVYDSHLTKERWIFQPTIFDLVYEFDQKEVENNFPRFTYPDDMCPNRKKWTKGFYGKKMIQCESVYMKRLEKYLTETGRGRKQNTEKIRWM